MDNCRPFCSGHDSIVSYNYMPDLSTEQNLSTFIQLQNLPFPPTQYVHCSTVCKYKRDQSQFWDTVLCVRGAWWDAEAHHISGALQKGRGSSIFLSHEMHMEASDPHHFPHSHSNILFSCKKSVWYKKHESVQWQDRKLRQRKNDGILTFPY